MRYADMAFMIKEMIDLKGILFLMLLTIPSIATTNLDCYGKAFHCVNSTHFMICVDLGRGVSTTIDDFIIPCPTTTVCRPTNRFECEFPTPTVIPLDISTIAAIQTSESEVVTSNPLVTTSIPFEENFNTLSPTTLPQSDQQSSTIDSVLPVNSANVVTITNASKSEIVIIDESISKDTNEQPGSTVYNNLINNVKSSVINSSNVESNFTSNLEVVSYETTTVHNELELNTTINIEQQVTDPSVLNTILLPINSQNGTASDIISAITEQIVPTTELFTNDFLKPLVNVTILDHASDFNMTAESTIGVKNNSNASKSNDNVIADDTVTLRTATTNSKNTTTTSSNDVHLTESETFFITNTNQTSIPYETITVINDVNQEQVAFNDQLGPQVTGPIVSNTISPTDITTTETEIEITDESISGDTNMQPGSTVYNNLINNVKSSVINSSNVESNFTSNLEVVSYETTTVHNELELNTTINIEQQVTDPSVLNTILLPINSQNGTASDIISAITEQIVPTTELFTNDFLKPLVNETILDHASDINMTAEPTIGVKNNSNASKSDDNVIVDETVSLSTTTTNSKNTSTPSSNDVHLTESEMFHIYNTNQTSIPYENKTVIDDVNEEKVAMNDKLGTKVTGSFVSNTISSTDIATTETEIVIIDKSILRDTNMQPGSTVDKNHMNNVKSNVINNGNVESNFTSNIEHNNLELNTNINIEQQVTDSPVLNTILQPNNSQNGTASNINNAITEQIVSNTELFTKDFPKPLVNVNILDHESEINMTAESIIDVKNNSNASKSDDNVIVDETVNLRTATQTTNLKNTTTASSNDVHLTMPEMFYITNTNQASIPYETTTVISNVNQEQVAINDQLGTQVTGFFVSNTISPTDIASTETIAVDITKSTYYQNPSKSATTPALISDHFSTSASDSVTVEPTLKVKEIVAAMISENNIITDFTSRPTNTNKSTDAQVNVFSSVTSNVFNKSNIEVTAEPKREVKKKSETSIIKKSAAGPIDGYKTKEASVDIISSNSGNVGVTTEPTSKVKEIVSATKSGTKIIIDPSIEPADKSVFTNISNFNNTNIEINVNITRYETTTATNLGNEQELFITNVTVEQPVTEPHKTPSVSSTSNNLGNNTIDIEITTTTVSSSAELSTTDFPMIFNNARNKDVNPVISTNSMTIKEIATIAPKNNVEKLKNSSSTLIKELELTTENIINNLQNKTESIGYNLNQILGNTTDRMMLNENVVFTNVEDDKGLTPTYKSENKTETSTIIGPTTKVQINEITTNQPLPSMLVQTTVAVTDKKESVINVIEDSFNQTSSRIENTSQKESVTSFALLPLSSFAADASNQINESKNTPQKYDSSSYTESLQTVTTKMPPTTIQDSVTGRSPTESSILKEYNEEVILPDQNKIIVKADEIITLSPPTITVDLNAISSSKQIEIFQTKPITMDTSTSLPLTDIKTTTPEYIGMKKTAGYPSKTIVYNVNDEKSTTIDLHSQPMPSNTVLTILNLSSSAVVETTEDNSLNKSETDILPDGNNDSNVPNRIKMQNQTMSAAAITKKENNIISTIFINKIAESVSPFNGTSINFTERNNIHTTETINTNTADPYTIEATELVTQSNVLVDKIVEKIDSSTTSSHVKSSNGNTDFVKTNQNTLMIPARNKSTGNVEVQKSQSEILKTTTEPNYDSTMTLSTITTQELDNNNKVNASTSQSEISSISDIAVETITLSMIKEVPVDINMSQHLRSTITNPNIVTTENILFKYSAADVQVTKEIPLISRTDAIVLKYNQTTTNNFGPNRYLKSGTNLMNEESVVSTAYTDIGLVTSVDKNVEGTTPTNRSLTVTKHSNVSLLETKESNVSETKLYIKLHNESKKIDSDVNTQSQSLIAQQHSAKDNIVTTDVSNISDMPVTGFPNNIEINTRNSVDIEIKTQSQISGDRILETTKSTNNGITLTEAPYTSTIDNKANHVPYHQIQLVNSNLNNASKGFVGRSNAQPVISGDKNLKTTTSINNGNKTEFPHISLIENKSNYISNQQIPHVISSLKNASNRFDAKYNNTQSLVTSEKPLGTTTSISNGTIVRQFTHTSLVENEANNASYQQILHATLNINNASNRIDAGSNIQLIKSGDPNIETTTSNNGNQIIKSLDTALVHEASNTSYPELPQMMSNLTTTSITNNKEDIIVVPTAFTNDLTEEPRGTIVVSTTSSDPIEPATNSMQKTITQANNSLKSVNSNIERQFVTKPVKIELSQTMRSTAQTTESYHNHDIVSNVKQLLEVTTTKTLVENEIQTENLLITPQEIEITNAAEIKPLVVIDVTPPTDLDTSLMKNNATADLYSFATTVNTLTMNTVDSSAITNQMSNKQVSISPEVPKSHQEPLKTSEDIAGDFTSIRLATKLVDKNLARTIVHSSAFTKIMNTDIDVKVIRAVTPTAGLRSEFSKTAENIEDNGNKPITGSVSKSPPVQKSSANNDGFKYNMEQTHSHPMSASLPSFSVSSEVSTSSDVLIDNNMESEKTHSGIMSLIKHTPSHGDTNEKKEKPEKNDKEIPEIFVYSNKENKDNSEKEESEVEERSELAMLPDMELVNLPVKVSSTTAITHSKKSNNKESNYTSTREELLNDFQSTTDIDSVGSPAIKINAEKITENDSKTVGSEIKKETPTHKLIEIITALNNSHTSNNQSKDQNKSTLNAHNTTVISNDQSSASRYLSQTKSTAVDDKQTEFPVFESASSKKILNKFTCTDKKRGRYADELDCRKFYICLGNSHVIEGTCPNNTVFSEIRKQCTNNLSQCIRNNQFRCVTEGHFSDFLNDNVYYICVKNNASSFIRFKLMCQNGYHLNKTSVRCLLNKKTKESIYKSEVSKSESSINNSDQSVSSPSAKLEEKKKPVKKFKCKKEGIFADRSDCRRYFECTKPDSTEAFRQKRKKCASDEIFHRDKKRCVDDESYECN